MALLNINWDNREPLLRDENGNAIMLEVTGPIIDYGDGIKEALTPKHEDFTHGNATPHQNPVVEEVATGWLSFIFGGQRKQVRTYALTENAKGEKADVDAIMAQAQATAMRNGQTVKIVSVSKSMERKSGKVEDATQRNRGILNRILGI